MTRWHIVWSDGTTSTVYKARGFRDAVRRASAVSGSRRDPALVRKLRVVGSALHVVRMWRLV